MREGLLVLGALASILSFIVTAGAQPATLKEASQLSDEPILRIEVGMHIAPIRGAIANNSCSRLVTGSDDKTVRLWSLPGGDLLKTFRVPIGEGHEGKVNAVTMSPDGSWIAAGGWTRTLGDHWVYVFDTATGETTRIGPSTGQAISDLVVSPDGKYLAATLFGGQGVRVWRKSEAGEQTWSRIGVDRDYGRNANATGAAFDKSGTLFTVAYDGKLRRYTSDRYSSPGRTAFTVGGKRPHSISLHPEQNQIAIGFSDTPRVDVYNANTLSFEFSADTREISNGSLHSVTWSSDGRRLYAAGTNNIGGKRVVRAWDQGGRGKSPAVLTGTDNTILRMIPCADGLLLTSADPSFGLVSATGERLLWRPSVTADMRGKIRSNLTVSADGTKVRFGLGIGGSRPVLFDLVDRNLVGSPEPRPDMIPAIVEGLSIKNWENSYATQLDGFYLDLQGERSNALAILPDRSGFILGTDNYLRFFDREGNNPWKLQAPAAVWGLVMAQQGKLLVAACADGTIRWYSVDRETGLREVLGLFVHAEDMRWIAWTPRGYYMSSEAADTLIGWHINRGWTAQGDFHSVSRFRNQYYRPDIVKNIITAANEGTDSNDPAAPIKTIQPPVVEIITPASPYFVRRPDITVRLKIRSPSGFPIKRLVSQVDGRPVSFTTNSGLQLPSSSESQASLSLVIPDGAQTLTFLAETENSLFSEPATIKLLKARNYDDPVPLRLFALIVGVGEYADPKLRLGDFPANDADDVAALFQTQQGNGRAFATVETRVLKHSAATFDNILDGLQWLRDKVVGRNDVALFYFSGHGVTNWGQSSYLLPADYERGKISRALEKGNLRALLGDLPGRVIVVVDACYAADGLDFGIRVGGRLDGLGVINELTSVEGGIIAFASSRGRSFAPPPSAGKNSYFTQAFLSGLKGEAAREGQSVIRTDHLPSYLLTRVQDLSENKQEPIANTSKAARPVPLAVVDR